MFTITPELTNTLATVLIRAGRHNIGKATPSPQDTGSVVLFLTCWLRRCLKGKE